MQEWKKISLILCVFGFLRDIRPSQPYLTEYLVGPWHNLTEQQVNQDIYPVATYSYLAQLIVIFLVTDILRYKPLIIVMGCCGIIVWSVLIWTNSILALQIQAVIYGTYLATEVAYYTYMYTKVDKAYYLKVTSYTRSAMLIGKLIGSVSGQFLIYYKVLDYWSINYATLSTQILATVWAFFLPGAKTSLYFHRQIDEKKNPNDSKDISKKENVKEAFKLLWTHFRNAYTNKLVLQWSLWYIVGVCGFLQILNYIQMLWKVIESDADVVWNGAAEAALTLFGAAFSLASGYIFTEKTNPYLGLAGLALISIIQGFCLILAAWPKVLYWSYIGYVSFGALFSFTVTVSSSEVSRHLQEDSFGLVFGFNTFIALLLQTLLTVIVVSKQGLALDSLDQFTVYGFYFIVVGSVYSVVMVSIYFIKKYKWNKSHE